jgi:hypothetical protein
MGSILAWTTAVAVLMVGMVTLHQMGVSIGPMITTFVRDATHLLGHSL